MQPSSTIRSDSVELVTARLPFAVNQRPGAWPLPVQTPEREGEPSAQSTHEPPPMRLAFSKSLARSPSAPQPGQGQRSQGVRVKGDRLRGDGATLVHPLVRLKGQNTKILEAVGDTSPIAVRGESTRRKFLPVNRNNSAQRLFRKASRQGSGRQRESATIEEDKDDENSGDERSRNVGLYITTLSVIFLTIGDIVLFFVFQMLLHAPEDFVCSKEEKRDGSGQEVHRTFVNIIIIALVIAFHFCYILERGRHVDKDGSWRAFYGRFLATNAWHLVTLLGSAVALTCHVELCHRDTRDLTYSFVRKLHLVFHGLRVLVVARCCWHLRADLRRRLQHAVSLNKRRYVDRDMGLDLDMTYIADRVVSMSLPCVDNAPYRNDIADVARFFASRHYGSFAVVNLCEAQEEGGNGNYDTALLFGQVQKCPFPDHNAPSFLALVNYCEASTDFLNAGGKNVIAVHCQGGKGRTGLLCCALLLWVGLCDTAEEALDYFAKRRTQSGIPYHKMSRVSSPSQMRYLGYLEQMISGSVRFEGFHPLTLHAVTIEMPPLYASEWHVALVIEQGGSVLFDSCKAQGPAFCSRAKETEQMKIECGDLLVNGDVTVRIYRLDMDSSIKIPEGTSAQIFQAGRGIRYGAVKGHINSFVAMHTAVLRQEVDGDEGKVNFSKEEIDGPHKDPAHEVFPPGFAISLSFGAPALQRVSSFQDLQKRNSLLNKPRANSPISPTSGSRPSLSPRGRQGSARSLRLRDAAGGGSLLNRSSPRHSLMGSESARELDTARDGTESSGSHRKKRSSVDSAVVCSSAPEPSSPISGPVREGPGMQPDRLEAMLVNAEVEENRVASEQAHVSAEQARVIAGAGALSVPRELVVVRALEKGMLARSSALLSFSRGEVVMDTCVLPPTEDGPMTLYYVLSGRVVCEPGKFGPVGGWTGCLRMSDMPTLATSGPGQLTGVFAMEGVVPGGRNIGGGLVYRARSAEVVVATVPLQSKMNDILPGEENSAEARLSDQDLCVVYESIARKLCNWSLALRHQLKLQKLPVKLNQSALSAVAARKQLYERVMTAHSLPISEKVLMSCEASLLDGRRTSGRLLLFKNWLIFSPTSAGVSGDVVVALEEVLSTELTRDVLTLHRDPSLDPHNSLDPTNSFRSSQEGSAQGTTQLPLGARLRSESGAGPSPKNEGSASPLRKNTMMQGSSFLSGMLRSKTGSAKWWHHSEISFVLAGGAADEGGWAGAGGSVAFFERCRYQLEMVRSRMDLDQMARIEVVLGAAGSVEGPHAERRESASGRGSDEALLKRWRLILDGEHVSARTMEGLVTLIASAPRITCRRGEVLVKQGSEERRVFFILSGKVCSRSSPGEKLDVRQGGDMMGARSFFDNGNRGATTTLVAETDSSVLVIERPAVDAACRDAPAAAARFFRALAMNLGVLVRWQFDLLEEEEEETLETKARTVRLPSQCSTGLLLDDDQLAQTARMI